jgi:hypothetical protein
MSKEMQPLPKENAKERLSRLGRNINAVGAVAIGGAALAIPGPNVILGGWAILNAAQAIGFEGLRRWAKKKKNQLNTSA